MKFWRLNHPLLIASLLCLFVSSASLALLLSLDRIIDWKISQTVKLRNGSAVFDAWKSTRSPSKVVIYMYNLTNPEETLQGQAPHLKAIGPYVYWEKEDKVNISWTEVDGIRGLRYFKRSLYTFDAALSVGDPKKDKVMTVSLPVLALSAAIKAGRDPTMGFLGLIRLLYSLELFTTQTVHGYLWGYEDPLLDLCSACDTKKVGLLHKSNNTLRGPYIIDAGLENSSNTGQLLSVDKKRFGPTFLLFSQFHFDMPSIWAFSAIVDVDTLPQFHEFLSRVTASISPSLALALFSKQELGQFP
ncbi:unnamed protein product [Mesocestoides corti]|uniref:Scavenger receptor class B member 1 n=2 Tax=Mesocestoides corti TaxID=53468 RepID=A0A0R3UMB0_MESCO|nr:unnamed protein product [Mesocestoides corti]